MRYVVNDADSAHKRLLEPSPFDRHYGLEILEANDETKLLRLRRGDVQLVADFAAKTVEVQR